MAYTISADHEHNLLYIKYQGDISIVERKSAVIEISAMLDELHFFNILVDLCDANMAADSLEEQDKFASSLSTNPMLSKCKLAYLSNTDLDDNFFIETMAKVRHIKCTHVTKLEDAYDWLNE